MRMKVRMMTMISAMLNRAVHYVTMTPMNNLLHVEKIIHWRHCHVMYGSIEHCRDHSHHTHFHAHEPLRWMNLIADGVHNFIDGVVIGASYLVSVPVGLATTLAVVFHEVPQELG